MRDKCAQSTIDHRMTQLFEFLISHIMYSPDSASAGRRIVTSSLLLDVFMENATALNENHDFEGQAPITSARILRALSGLMKPCQLTLHTFSGSVELSGAW